MNRVFNAISFGILAIAVTSTIVLYGNLPDQVASHFGINGLPDATDDKSSIWDVVGTAVAIFAVLSALSWIIGRALRSVVSGKDKRMSLGKVIASSLSSANLVCSLTFAYLIIATIQVSLGKWVGLGEEFFWILMFSVLGVIVYTVVLFLVFLKHAFIQDDK